MIEARDLVKDYGSFRALKGVSLSIEAGEVVGLLGPNGAGKSTTMRITTGYLAADERLGDRRRRGGADDPPTCPGPDRLPARGQPALPGHAPARRRS